MQTLASIADRGSNSFGVVRLIAATLVVVSHAFLLTGGTLTSEPFSQSTSFPLGAHAVNIFFALSGFLVAGAWYARPQFSHFIAGRVLRILPGLFAVTLAVLMVAALLLQPANPSYLVSQESVLFFIRTVFLLDGGGSLASVIAKNEVTGAILATVWTLRFEVFCYLSLPIFAAIALRIDCNKFLIVLTVLTLAGGWLIFNEPSYHSADFLDKLARFFFSFYLGVSAWFLRARLPLSWMGIVLLGGLTWLTLPTPLSQLSEITFVAYAAFWIGSLNFGKLGDLTDREDLSYGIYLMAYPIQQAAIFLLPMQNPWLNMAASLLIAAPLAFLSWRLIERPSLRLRHQFSSGIDQLGQLLLSRRKKLAA